MQKKSPRYSNSESPDVDLFFLFQEHVLHPMTSAQNWVLERLCEMDLEAQEKGINPDPFAGHGRETMSHIDRCLVALSSERGGLDEASVIADKEVFALLEKLMKSWAQSIAPQLLESRDAYGLMLSSINSTLQAVSDQAQRNAHEEKETEPPVQLAMPPELPSLEVLQANIERARGGLHRLRAQQAAGEVVLVTDVTSKQFDRCRRVRDQFLALAPRLSGVAIGWRTSAEAKTELIRGVSKVLAAW